MASSEHFVNFHSFILNGNATVCGKQSGWIPFNQSASLGAKHLTLAGVVGRYLSGSFFFVLLPTNEQGRFFFFFSVKNNARVIFGGEIICCRIFFCLSHTDAAVACKPPIERFHVYQVMAAF